MSYKVDYNKRVELYDLLVEKHPDVDRKGKTMPYTSLNGHMFSFLNKDGMMGLRLSKEDLNQFMETYNTSQMIQHGRIMKEYVEIPLEMLSDTQALSTYFQKSLDYVSGLKPKATKKK